MRSEEKAIKYMQICLDCMYSYHDEEKKIWRERYKACAYMYEILTGKKVSHSNHKLVIKEV